MDQVNNKSICPYAFKAAMVTIDSSVRPCCRYQDHKSERPVVDTNNTLKDIFYNSSYYNDLRDKMLRGEQIPGCKRCYKEEEAGQKSMRNQSKLIAPSTDIQLEYIETESGRHCNLKCRSCGPEISTGWNEDLKQSDYLANEHEYIDRMEELNLFHYNDALELLTKEECSKLQILKVTGGEPFLSKSFLKFIDNLYQWDFCKNITIVIYTNTTFVPKIKFIKALERFKSVSLQLSIDSVGKRNDFLRSGSDWKTVEQVADFWFNFKSENPKSVNVAICTTVSIFNILTLDQLFKWLIEKEKEHSIFIDIYFVVLQSPKYMAIFNFSRKHKEQIKQVISQIPGKPRQTSKLIKMLDNAVPTTISARKDLKDTTDHIDVIRSEDWKQVFPEVFKLIYG